MRIKKKICAALAFAVFICGGCDKLPENETQERQTGAADTGAVSRPSPAVIADEEEPVRAAEKQPLRIAAESYGGTYSYFPQSDFEKLISGLTGVKLAARDRYGKAVLNGINGESRAYSGKNYFYTGISDISERYDGEADETVYSVKLRDDVRFSDGETLDADDVIFTLYMLLDTSVENFSPLNGAKIKGIRGYRTGYAIADRMTEEEIAEAMQTDGVRQEIKEAVIRPMMTEFYEFMKMIYGYYGYYDNSEYKAYMEKCSEPKDLLAFFYSIDAEYDPADADDMQVIDDLTDMYGGDFELLGKMNSGDPDEFRSAAELAAISYLASESGEKDVSDHIPGIVKTGSFSLDITVEGSSSDLPQLLTDVTVLPLHYYGDESRYDCENHKFGFDMTAARDILREKADKPLGAGAYYLEKTENETAYLSANEFYYKGAPLTEKIEITRAGADDMVNAVIDGNADISFPKARASVTEAVEAANGALEKLAAYTVTRDGYGFIGINAKTVNIGGEPLSEESCMLRRALAAAVYPFRESSVSEYYGQLGFTVNYPLPVPQIIKGTEYDTYADAVYCCGIDGDPFLIVNYADESARRKAIKKACLDYFGAAGYTVEDGTVTGAPEGGSTEFHAVIAAGGTGDHPSYGALRDAKTLLGEIGITLEITDTADASALWSEISGGTQQIWAYVWETGTVADLSEMYSPDNLFGVEDEKLSEYVRVTGTSSDKAELSEAYTECYRLIYGEYAVVIPMYQRSGCVLVNALRVDTGAVPEDMTCWYGWTDEIEKISQKG